MKNITLHYLHDCPYCQAVIKHLHFLNLSFKMIPAPKDRAEVKRISNQSSVPVLVDGSNQEVVLTNTIEIIQYLNKTYANDDKKTEQDKLITNSNIYGIETKFSGSLEEAEVKVIEALKNVGFGVLTYIDIQKAFKEKLNLDRKAYKILGACNPKIASKALEEEENLGLLLPCNIIIYENNKNEVIVSAINPRKMFSVVNRIELVDMAKEVEDLLRKAILSI